MSAQQISQSRGRAILSSKFLRLFVVALALVVAAWFVTNGFSAQVSQNQTEFLANAVRRSAVQCYALEGLFPQNVTYLEQNYGLIIDHVRYVVYYEPMGDNLIPQVRVFPVEG
jgi:hypothetical protein